MTNAATGPGYREVADDLRQKIRSGKMRPGDAVPAIPQLMSTYGASQNVVRDAVKQLRHERLVETHAGRGSVVTDPESWTTTEAAEIMQQIAEVRAVVDALQAKVAAIERRLP